MQDPQDRRTLRQRRGDATEALAARYLQRCGLVVMERGFRRRVGELDLICVEPGTGCIVFVEVRYRAGFTHGGPLASVDASKRRKLLRTARAWLQKRRVDPNRPARIDVVGICPLSQGVAGHDQRWQRVEGHALCWCQAVT